MILREGLLDAPPQLVVLPPGYAPVSRLSNVPLRRSDTGGHSKVDIPVDELQDPPGQQLDLSLTFSRIRLLIRMRSYGVGRTDGRRGCRVAGGCKLSDVRSEKRRATDVGD